MSTAIEVNNLLLLKNNEPLLNIPHLHIPRGEVVGIMGYSGSGKTTLLKTLALLEQPDQGSLSIVGQEVQYREATLLPLRRKIALVFQEPLFRDASVRDNVALGLKLRKVPKALIKQKVDDCLAKLGLSHLAHRHPNSLSKGEACQVSLAQALVIEPEILLLDEPLAALDPATRAAILEKLAEIIKETGITTVYATHDYSELSLFAHRAMLLYQGTIIQQGTVLDVLNQPQSAAAASLLGVDNIIPGFVGNVAEDEVEFNPAGTDVRLYGIPKDSGLYEAYALIRSEEIELDAFPGAQWNAVKGTISRIQPSGSQLKIFLDCGFPLVVTIPHRKYYLKKYVPGQEVTAVFDPDRTMIVRKLPRQ
ncbi:MAG: ABC transporter ATP-binding protein [Clostridia bacterium]|jgi:tungstate transport system ATP-binding protein|nr:ABC transporter ATP-binding protein [Clostridia bacterium]